MKTPMIFALAAAAAAMVGLVAQQPPAAAPQNAPLKKGQPTAPLQLTGAQLKQVQDKVAELDALVRALKMKRPDRDLVADVEIYASAGKLLLEFPEDFFTLDGVQHALDVLDTGIERARQLQNGQSPWT